MAKNTLEEKIKNIGFWTIIFFVLYLIIGFLLESEWLSKILKLSDIYDLLKDGLSITVALLAPVVAFVLFSDWREQHLLIKQERLNEKFYLITRRISRRLFKLATELTSGDNKRFHEQSIEVDGYITELWDILFEMGLSQTFGDTYLASGFEIQKEFKSVFNALNEERDDFDKYLNSNKDEFSDMDYDPLFEVQSCQTLAIAETMGKFDKMLPEGLMNQVTNK